MTSSSHATRSPRYLAPIYARKSIVKDKRDEISPEHQVMLCVEEATRRGRRYEVFKEADIRR